MVAKITIPKSIEAALNYNEKKVQKGAAECISAINYLHEAGEMNFYQKLDGFERLNSLNERATTKTLHVSLNFDPSEKLAENKLLQIAYDYMQKIGFGNQPYLVYKHEDAGHPHIHIVSTTIKHDGSRINTHNIGRNQSEIARKEIEHLYGLIKAERQQPLLKPGIKPIDAKKVVYGKSETKRSISNIVNTVFSQYKFSSLPEFNAALKQFNVVADRGKEDGRIFKYNGLVYRILDSVGNKVGVPIKASSMGCKPILENLEKKFSTNQTAKESLKQQTKTVIDNCLHSNPVSMKDFVTALLQKNIYTVLRKNSAGKLYGITFVDNQNKLVFNGNDLGKQYSAAALENRFSNNIEKIPNKDETKSEASAGNSKRVLNTSKYQEQAITATTGTSENMLDIILSTKEQYDNTPHNLIKKKRKKKKKDRNW